MKNLFVRVLAVVALAIAATVQTMAQQSFAYQAVIRNSKGELVANKEVSLKFSLINGGKTHYAETQKAKANQYGNISVMIGEGEKTEGDFAKVPWNTLDVTLKVEVDVNGGTDYISLGETKLNPVPYAMYAASVDKAVGVGSAAKGVETLFEVDDRDGRPVFAVTNDGIVVYVDDQDNGKMKRSGFLVTGREATKGEPAKEYFAVTTDGTQIFVDPDASGKLRRSGFLVTGREATKNGSADYLSVDGNGTTVYVDGQDDSKLRRSGFLVTGRDATKVGGQEMFAVDGSQTIVYVDEQDGGKLRRSGFLVTGRDATKADNGQILSINSERTDFQTKAFSVANYAPQGSATATAPVSVLVVSNQQVAMKSDIALEGDMLEAAYGNFEHEYTFDLQMLCGTNYSIMFDTLLARAGVDDKGDEYSGYNDSLMYVFDDGLLVGSDGEYWGEPTSLYFDEDFRRTDEGSAVLSIEKVYEEYSTIWFAVHNEDTAFKTTLQFALGYYDDSWKFHTVLFTVNLTVDRMIYEYGVESGKVQYLFTHHNQNWNVSTDTIDYCFSDKGFNNFYCVSDYLNKDNDNNRGRGKYQYVANFNSKSESNAIGGMNFLCTWYDGGWTPLNTTVYSFPMFSVAGVAMPIEGILFNNNSGIAGMQLFDFNMNDVADAGIVNNYTISDNKTIGGVKKYTFTHITDSIRLYTFYTYQGLVLQIDRTNVIDDITMTVLKCISFDSNVGEQSLHRWLKNSGVTNYDVIASHFGDYVYNDGSDHYYVDLDLPRGTLWAANNVGAPSPYDWGDYLAWGELAEKGSYSQNGYNVKELISSVDNPNDVGLINDAAWWWGNNGNGSSWCMPSSADWQELIDECFWVWVKGEPYVRVYKAEEDKNKGQSYTLNVDSEVIDELNDVPCLYLPFSGSFEGTTLRDSDIKGLYWASDVQSDPTNAYSLEFGNQGNKQVRENKRYQGLQVRAVRHAQK